MAIASLNNKIIIRRASKEDGKAVLNLMKHAFAQYESKGVKSKALLETIFDIYEDLNNNIVLVVEDSAQIIGSLRLELLEQNKYYLKRFAILPKYQDQGYGTILFKQAEKEVTAHKGQYIYLHSTLEDERLLKFYQKLGFKCEKVDNNLGYKRGLWVKKLQGDE